MHKDIYLLMQQCVDFMKNRGRAISYIEYISSMWNRCVVPYLQKKGTNEYSVQDGEDILNQLFSVSTYSDHWRDMMRLCIRILNDILTYGCIRPHKDSCINDVSIGGPFGKEMQLFLNLKREQGLESSSIRIYHTGLCRFNNYCEKNGVKTWQDVSLSLIQTYVSSNSRTRLTCVRLFLEYAYNHKMCSKNFTSFMHLCPKKEFKTLISFYTSDEIDTIERSVNRNTKSGKRNYAILLMASRLGLRLSDIVNLKFDNIDWRTSKIEIIQKKTNKRLTLPLLDDVGNSIIDYLQNARPSNGLPYVFLRASAPYDEPFTSGMASNAIQRIIERSGVKIGKRRHGAHALRHSLASNLLENGIILPTISSILGHTNTETTQKYVSINIQGLMKSALSVTKIDKEFYNQKSFYRHGKSI